MPGTFLQAPHVNGLARFAGLVSDLPECGTFAFQTKLRERMVTLLNAVALEAPKRTQQDRDLFGAHIGLDLPLIRISRELNLGMEFYELKKGPELLMRLVRELSLDTLIALGRKVNQERVKTRQRDYRNRNAFHLPLESPGDDLRDFRVSSCIDDLLDEIPDVIANLDELREAEKVLEKVEAVMTLQAELQVHPDAISAHLKQHRSSVREITRLNEVGFVEIALFVQVFAERFEIKPTSLFSLPAECFDQFRVSLQKGQGKMMAPEEVEAYREASKRHFSGNQAAANTLDYILSTWLQYLKNSGPEKQRSQFPCGSISTGIITDDDIQVLEDAKETLEKVHRKKNQKTDERGAPYYKDDLAACTDQELVRMIKFFPDIGSWQRFLCDRTNPEKTAQVLNRMANLAPREGVILACDLLIGFLSMEDIKDMKFRSCAAIIAPHDGRSREEEEGVFAFQVFRLLSPSLITYILEGNHSKDSIPELFESLCAAIPQGLFCLHPGFWHPKQLPKDFVLTVDELVNRMNTCTSQNQVEQCLRYLLQGQPSFLLEDDFWDRLFSYGLGSDSRIGLLGLLVELLPAKMTEVLVMKYFVFLFLPAVNDDLIDIPMVVLLKTGNKKVPFSMFGKKGGYLRDYFSGEFRERLTGFICTHVASKASEVFPSASWKPSSHILTDERALTEEDLPLLSKIYQHRRVNRALQDLVIARLKKAPVPVRRAAQEGFLNNADVKRLR